MDRLLGEQRLRARLLTAALLAATALVPQPALAQGQYPPEVVQDFVGGCVHGGGTENTCTCTVSKIASRYSLQDFAAMVGRMHATGQVPEEISEDINACVAEGSS
jgi:hypothetical protein